MNPKIKWEHLYFSHPIPLSSLFHHSGRQFNGKDGCRTYFKVIYNSFVAQISALSLRRLKRILILILKTLIFDLITFWKQSMSSPSGPTKSATFTPLRRPHRPTPPTYGPHPTTNQELAFINQRNRSNHKRCRGRWVRWYFILVMAGSAPPKHRVAATASFYGRTLTNPLTRDSPHRDRVLRWTRDWGEERGGVGVRCGRVYVFSFGF